MISRKKINVNIFVDFFLYQWSSKILLFPHEDLLDILTITVGAHAHSIINGDCVGATSCASMNANEGACDPTFQDDVAIGRWAFNGKRQRLITPHRWDYSCGHSWPSSLELQRGSILRIIASHVSGIVRWWTDGRRLRTRARVCCAGLENQLLSYATKFWLD